jgi:hypothetical protein
VSKFKTAAVMLLGLLQNGTDLVLHVWERLDVTQLLSWFGILNRQAADFANQLEKLGTGSMHVLVHKIDLLASHALC